MVGYAALEESLEASRPIELFRFALGSSTFRYTAVEDAITIGGDTYEPESISRNNIALGIEHRDRPLEITLPHNNAFVERYKLRPPAERATVSVIRVQRDETPSVGTTQALVYKGFIREVGFPDDGKQAVIKITSYEAGLNRSLPRVTFQGMCNWFLYDGNCTVSQAAHTYTGIVSAESGVTLTVPGLGSYSNKFPSGFIRPVAQNDFRTILAQSGDVITLNWPFPTSLLGANVDVSKGCDRLIDGDCQNEYNNVINFGGYAFIPDRNIFEAGLT